MVKAYPQRPDDGKDYEWNEDEYRWIERPSNKADWSFGNWVKTGLRLGTADGQAWGDLIKGDTDKLARDAETLTNLEIGLAVGLLIATIGASVVGVKLGSRSVKTASKSKIAKSKSSKSRFVERTPTEREIDAFVNEYNKLSESQKLNILEDSVDYKHRQFQEQTEQARLKAQTTRSAEDFQAYNDLLKEGDEFVNNEYSPIKREVKEAVYQWEKKRGEEQALEREQERQRLEDIDLARDNDEVMNEWYEEYGTNQEGVDTDLQELGRRVMGMLDPDGLGEIELPEGSMGQYFFDNFPNSAEREAITSAYSDSRIWNTLKANYKKALAAGAISVMGGVVTAISNVDTNTITTQGAKDKKEDDDIIDDIEKEEDADADADMNLVEDVEDDDDDDLPPAPTTTDDERRERIEDEGVEEAEEELGLDPNKEEEEEKIEEEGGLEIAEEELGLDPDKVKGKDRLVPSGEPEPDLPTKDKPVDTTTDKVVDTTTDKVVADVADVADADVQDAPKTTVSIHNIDELILRTLQMSTDVYENIGQLGGSYSWITDFQFPILFHKTNTRLFVAFRGTNATDISNVLTDLDIRPIGIPESEQELQEAESENLLSNYDNLSSHMTDQFANIKMHRGFLNQANKMYPVVYEKIISYDDVSEVIFTGHSAGGALATIFHYVYTHDLRQDKPPIGRGVSFASPRVVYSDGLEKYNFECSNFFRVWNIRDPVTYVPLHQPTITIPLISGFAHVGQSLCLNGKDANNNTNKMIYIILKNGQAELLDLMKLQNEGSNKLVDFLLSPEYESALFSSTIECLKNVSVKKGVSKQMLAQLVYKLNRDMKEIREYADKCKLTEPYGLREILEAQELGESDEQQNWYVTSQVLFSILANLSLTKEHNTDTYKKLVDDLIDIEITQRSTFEEASNKIDDATEEIVEQQTDILEPIIPEALGMVEMNANNFIGQVVQFE